MIDLTRPVSPPQECKSASVVPQIETAAAAGGDGRLVDTKSASVVPQIETLSAVASDG